METKAFLVLRVDRETLVPLVSVAAMASKAAKAGLEMPVTLGAPALAVLTATKARRALLATKVELVSPVHLASVEARVMLVSVVLLVSWDPAAQRGQKATVVKVVSSASRVFLASLAAWVQTARMAKPELLVRMAR